MAVPTRAEAEEVLASYELPTGITIHARGVARIAAEAARLVQAAGVPLDPDLVEAAALLHDVDKIATRRSGEPHGIVGARWLTELGYPELAPAVASHPVNCLSDEARFPRGWPSVIVSIADRRVAQRFMAIDERIDDLVARHPDYRISLEAAREPAHALEAELAETTGLDLDALEARLRAAWEEAG